MGVRIASAQSTTIVNPTVITTAETIVAQAGPLNLAVDSASILLQWFVNITIGTAGGAVVCRLRRGLTVASPRIDANTGLSVTATQGYYASGCYVDNSPLGAELFYIVTVSVISATGNSTINDVCLTAFVL